MAYYFECDTCNKKECFGVDKNNPPKNKVFFHKGKKQDYETGICKSCLSKKVRLKGNYIIF